MTTGTIHNVTQIDIEERKGSRHSWVHFVIHDKDGGELELDIFFALPHQREMFLEQVGMKASA